MPKPPRKERLFFNPASRVPESETPPTPSALPAPPANRTPKSVSQPAAARDPRIILPGATTSSPDELSARQGVAPNIGIRGPRSSGRVRRRLRTAALLAVVTLVAWGTGYRSGQHHAEAGSTLLRGQERPGETLTAEEQAAVDAAFTALRSGRYAEARQLFTTLVKKHRRWTSLHSMIALTILYQGDALGFKKYVGQSQNSGELPSADSSFLLAHYSLSTGEFADANQAFGESAAADPTRPQTYYFWGDCLMQWGKPAEAVKKFRAARLCNLYPAADSLYETRLWLAEIKSGLEAVDGSGEQITQALTAERPKSSALFAGAARAIKNEQFTQAAEYLSKARLIADPILFHVVLLDPSFHEECLRPEFKGLYAEELPEQR